MRGPLEPDLRTLLAAISEASAVPPEERLDAIRALVHADTHVPPAGSFGAATLAFLGSTRPGGATIPLPRDRVAAEDTPDASAPPVPPHLEVVAHLSTGGMGEVWRVRDRETGAPRALKTVRLEHKDDPVYRALFERELRTTDNLQHPGIPPIADHGVLEDGRPFYAMRIYEGRTLQEELDAPSDPRTGLEALRARVEHLRAVSEIVGYAHAHGVLHRDLKPENVYLGDREVIVLDWGIAERLVVTHDGRVVEASGNGAGTAGYKAPEVDGGRVGPAADVWSIGVMLEEVVARCRGEEGFPEVRELRVIAAEATRRDPAARPRDATELGLRLRQWLDAAARRARGRELVAEADAEGRAADALSERARVAREAARRVAATVDAWSPVEQKRRAWEAEDEVEQLERRASRHLVERERLLGSVLTHAPELPEAHQRLAAIYRARHARAEDEGDRAGSERWEILLRAHDRGEQSAYLRGDGAVTVVTDPPGAEAVLHRYELRDRRLTPVPVRTLGRTPLHEVPVPHGSWMIELSLPGHRTVQHPIHVGRLEHVDGIAPGESAPRPIRLPTEAEVGPEDCVVTPGWTFTGWDREAANAPPDGRVWVEGFVARQYLTTNAEYLEFLNALFAAGREAEAIPFAPQQRGTGANAQGRLEYGLGPQGFFLAEDVDGTLWQPRWPVIMVNWFSATAYARWRAERDGVAWRLPREDEWERAARGADKRKFPWGDHWDPSWALTRARAAGVEALLGDVDVCPEDRGPFGVAALAGVAREWCENRWGTDAPEMRGAPATRGGGWSGGVITSRIVTRTFTMPVDRGVALSFRLVRPLR